MLKKLQDSSSPAVQFNVEDSVGYLLGRARTKLAKSLDLALIEHNITHAQGRIVQMLATGKCTTSAELVREMYIDSASMTRMIDRLEKRGLIERTRSEKDRRIIALSLSVDGKALAKLLPAVYLGAIENDFSHFHADEVVLLDTLLRKYLAGKQGSEQGPGMKMTAS